MASENFEDEEWLRCSNWPGYEISNYARVRQLRKSGNYKMIKLYRDSDPRHIGWNFCTMWKNDQFHKVAVRHLLQENWVPVIEKSHAEKHKPADNKYKKRTRNPEIQKKKFQEMIDGFDPMSTSASAYIRYLRTQGYTFTTHLLSIELSKKKRAFLESVNQES